MEKIVVIMILLLAFFAVSCQDDHSSSDVEKYEFCGGDWKYFFCEDFENGELDGNSETPLTAQSGGGSGTFKEEENGNKYLRIKGGTPEALDYVVYWEKEEKIDHGILSVSMKFLPVDGFFFVAVSEGILDEVYPWFVSRVDPETGKVKASSKEDCGSYFANKWNVLQLYLNLDKKTYSVKVNGEIGGCKDVHVDYFNDFKTLLFGISPIAGFEWPGYSTNVWVDDIAIGWKE